MLHRSKPEQSVLIGASPGKNDSPAMLVLPPPHPLRLLFMGFLPRSFSRSTSLSGTPLDPLIFLFCLFFPRTVSLRQFACIHASLFFSSCLICSLLPFDNSRMIRGN